MNLFFYIHKTEQKIKRPMKANFYDKPQKKLLKSFSAKPIRNSKGKIIKHAPFQNSKSNPINVIPPEKKWFQVTRSISQSEVDNFENLKEKRSPYEILLNRGKIPFSLYNGEVKNKVKPRIRKVKEKKCKILYSSFEDMKNNIQIKDNEGVSNKNQSVKENTDDQINNKENKGEFVKIKGQSKRIWNELYKVLDSSDVVAHVIDARDPQGTRCECVEKYLSENASHKHLIYILNKVDLVPTDVTARNIQILSKKHPTIAYHANSLKNHYGRNNLISVFKQFSKLINKKTISIGFVGYPNIGKSSIINTLKEKKVSSVAPIPGQTKTWQYVALTKKIYLIDSPGIVPANNIYALLNGAVRIEKLDDPETLIEIIIEKHKNILEKVYEIPIDTDQNDFLKQFCNKYGKILKNNQPNFNMARNMILRDWIQGKIPYYVPIEENIK